MADANAVEVDLGDSVSHFEPGDGSEHSKVDSVDSGEFLCNAPVKLRATEKQPPMVFPQVPRGGTPEYVARFQFVPEGPVDSRELVNHIKHSMFKMFKNDAGGKSTPYLCRCIALLRRGFVMRHEFGGIQGFETIMRS